MSIFRQMTSAHILVAMAPKRQSREAALVATVKVSPSRRGVVRPVKVEPHLKQGIRASRAKVIVTLRSTVAAQAEILHRATEVIGSEDAAMRWMGTPVPALDYATPISLLHSESGVEAVRTVLGRLEHGVL